MTCPYYRSQGIGARIADQETIRPRIALLTQPQITQIHESALRVLSGVGLRVDSQRARQLLLSAGARAADDSRVFVPPELVEWALRVAPSTLDVYDRQGTHAFTLGHGASEPQARFGIGVTCLYYQDPQSDAVTPFTRPLLGSMVRLGGQLDSFDLVSTVGVAQDLDASLSDLYAALEMVANTTKPLVVLVAAEAAFPDVLDLLEHLCGDLSAQPFVIPYFNPITPLVINAATADKMWSAIERGLPFIYSSYGMAGATTPITPTGTLVLLHAELLAGLTLSQLIKQGTPVILGCLPAYFDMRGMGSFYDAHSYWINLACAEMMAHYGLPHAGTSGSGIGWGPDPIAFGHQWINHLTSCMGKVGLVPFVGDNLGSKAFSPVLAVYANEVIAQVRRLAQGVSFDDITADWEEIAQVGPGANYLTTESTLGLFRQAYYRSGVFPQLTLEAWQEQGCPRAMDVLRRYTQDLLDQASPPQDHGKLMAKGEEFIESLQRRSVER
jgi:trimethylamine--corrinoid protein Co-methyltransferase